MSTPDPLFMLAAVAIGSVITLLLRAVPFAILRPLRSSKFVQAIGRWMPAGLLLILAVVMLSGEFAIRGNRWWIAAVAAVVTVIVHLLCGRRALLSIIAGTGAYVAMLNLF